uniref:Putative fat-like cadherin-related tumor suppressor-like protein n=1 Tax=Magallana gigas TaxID=29159 RepID=K1R081_MAGGI
MAVLEGDCEDSVSDSAKSCQTQSCTNCGGDGSCNMNSVCNNGCLPGFYSLACAQSCGKCGGNGSCNRLSRFCDESSCLPRYFGPLCIQLCPLNCGGDGSCDFQTANCLQGCKSRFSGTRCELSVACPSSTCRDPCQSINGGICTSGCRSGYFGEICNRVCNCQNNGACVQDTGVCESISQTTSVTVPTKFSDGKTAYQRAPAEGDPNNYGS